MKIGRDAAADVERVWIARDAIGKPAELFVDANGAYGRKQALQQAEVFADPPFHGSRSRCSADDLDGLRLIRDRAPTGMDIAAGEYGYDSWYFRRMLDAGAVDVLQADATRCAGFTGFFEAVALSQAHHLPLSAHCAPTLHVHAGCAAIPFRHLEYFHDHVRIENMLFDGVPQPRNGKLYPDLCAPASGSN